MTFLVFGLLALTSTSLAVHALKRSDGERHLAGEAIRSLTEEIGALAGEARTNPNGWSLTVAGAYGAPGDRFEVEGLTTLRGEPTVGTIEVITDERVTDADLGVPLGMPRDLDNDGFTNTADVSGTATVLPVLLRLRWTGVTGELEMVHGFYVTGI